MGLLDQEAVYAEHKGQIDGALRTLWLLWAGCLAEPVVLIILVVVLGSVMSPRSRATDAATLVNLRVTFGVLGAAAIASSVLLRRYLLSPQFKGFRATVRPAASASFAFQLAIEYTRRIFPSMVLPGIPAILGFVLFLLGDRTGIFYLFAIPSFLAALWQRPGRDEIISLLSQLAQDEQPPRDEGLRAG